MKRIFGTLGAVALGAAAMYIMDPKNRQKNRQKRRAMIKDKAKTLARKEGEMIANVGRSLRDRVKGEADAVRGK